VLTQEDQMVPPTDVILKSARIRGNLVD